ncbi:hypothetical protein M409DRAFT_29421 [Zasmidium cellare ATCC 36951]|uniref:Uncharacterized protein n=1 Tax=Zasmidium cellare ATCC 36951 TaxID=1080233 RepID=A0A6A6BZG5_ZASCE|nr:uncharacterized protein M409DRAFT_29421 [Zasmidium cellare ATCC 36951]KAF2160125.1 hypothetical protein M409DRAFT_29421 [Zasmidium cellare ATCC 36951]
MNYYESEDDDDDEEVVEGFVKADVGVVDGEGYSEEGNGEMEDRDTKPDDDARFEEEDAGPPRRMWKPIHGKINIQPPSGDPEETELEEKVGMEAMRRIAKRKLKDLVESARK